MTRRRGTGDEDVHGGGAGQDHGPHAYRSNTSSGVRAREQQGVN